MLRRLLNSHPDIAMPAGELNFAVAFDPDAVQDMRVVYRGLLYNRGYWNVGVAPRFLGDFTSEMRAFVEDIGRQHESQVAGGIVHDHIDRLVRIWPNAKLVRIVRDVRDVYASARPLGLGGNAWSVATTWVREERSWDRLAASLGPRQALLVRYEDMVHEPDRELQRIFAFLGCTHDAPLSGDEGWGSPHLFATSISRGKGNRRASNYVIEAVAREQLYARGYEVENAGAEPFIQVLSPVMAWHDKIWRRRAAIKGHGLIVIALASLARRLHLSRLARLSRRAMLGREEEAARLRRFRHAGLRPAGSRPDDPLDGQP